MAVRQLVTHAECPGRTTTHVEYKAVICCRHVHQAGVTGYLERRSHRTDDERWFVRMFRGPLAFGALAWDI